MDSYAIVIFLLLISAGISMELGLGQYLFIAVIMSPIIGRMFGWW